MPQTVTVRVQRAHIDAARELLPGGPALSTQAVVDGVVAAGVDRLRESPRVLTEADIPAIVEAAVAVVRGAP